MKILHKIFLLIGVLLASACGKDFIDQVPETSRSKANGYKTALDFSNAITGCYAAFKLNGVYGNCNAASGVLNLGEVTSDNATYGSTRSAATNSIWNLKDFNFALSNTLFTNAWAEHYIAIGRANTVLARLPAANIGSLQSKYEAEAKFIRAYMYFNLVRWFGDVPLVTVEFVDDPYAASNLVRDPSSAIYSLIIEDLKFAENNLPSSIPEAEMGRISKWAAKALLGKVYLTQKNYTAASAKLAEVINSGLFSTSASSYAEIFLNTTSYALSSKEVLLAVQYKSGLVGQGSSISSSTLPWGVDVGPYGLLSGVNGDGFMQPTKDIDDAYEAGDLRKAATIGKTPANERYIVKYLQKGSRGNDADIDFPVLRYGDIVLMQAEALNEQNLPGDATPFLNLTRARAGLAAKNGLNQVDMRQAIEDERRLELAFEGHRWNDLVRTGRYLPVMTAKSYAVKAFHKLYPVPQRERGLNPALTQNPEY